MHAPLVYVIIINWNGRAHLAACFQSLLASSYSNAVFLLVDNASTDDSVAYVQEQFGGDDRVAILVLPENRGWSGGNNAGIRQATAAGADYLFLLNNDTATAPEALEVLVARMESNDRIGALAPRMVLFDQPELLNSVGLTLSVIGAAWDTGIGRIDAPVFHCDEPVVGVCGGAMFIRSRVLEATGLLPEDFEIYLDDLDLCLRIWNAGFRIERCAGAVVQHKFSATMGTGARARYKYYLNTRNRFRILLRHFPTAAWTRILPRLIQGELRAVGRAVLSGAPWRIVAHARAWLAALGYWPEARRFRRAQPVRWLPAFWPQVVSSPLFCPAIRFPVKGWYPPVVHRGGTLHPMARRAWTAVSEGTLQISLMNCYPAVGDARVVLFLNDSPLGRLETDSETEATFDVDRGTLVVVAESLFPMEITAGTEDVGAWLRMCNNDRPMALPDVVEPLHVTR